MPFQVKIRQIAEPLSLEPRETILEAALAAGHQYPCGCQAGNCGACKSALLSGEVELLPYSDFALTDEERAAGLVLACRSVPHSDVEIAWLEADDVASHPLRRLACEIIGLEMLTHDIRQIRLRVLSGGPFDFSAGQYAAVTFDGLPARDYSMASLPGDPVLEFHVRAMDGGSVSQHVRRGLKLGDRVRVEGPLGIAFLREKHTGPVLALAGGSGLAPIKSVVERALQVGFTQPISLYLGVRDEPDLYLEDHFRALEARYPNFRFVPVLSEAKGRTKRRKGMLADVVRKDFRSLDGGKAYLAGPPLMVESCIAALQAIGVRRVDCHADAFYTEADKARRAAS